MNKTLKRVMIILLSIVVLAGAVWGVMTIIRNSSKKPVNVYKVSDISMNEYYGDMRQSYGQITENDMQKIYVSDTQTITEIYVGLGQEVHAGDAVFKYDTTMSEIDLKKAELDLEKKKLELDTTQKELNALYNATTLEALQAEYDSVSAQYNAEYEAEAERRAQEAQAGEMSPYPALPLGNYSWDDPRYVNAADITDINILFTESGLNDIYVVFVTVVGDSTTGAAEYTEYHGVHLVNDTGIKLEFFEPAELRRLEENVQEEEEPIDNDTLRSLENQLEYISSLMAYSYPREELLRMQNEKQVRIGELDIEIRMADVELKRKQKEFDNGYVIAEIDGVIKSMVDPRIANENNEPSMVISAGGGYFINATVSELDLQTVSVGTPVFVNSWTSGVSCEGTISSIGTEPVESNSYSSADNNNVSWYPLIVFVDEDQDLKEGDYAEISYEKTAASSNAWYLSNMMIRQENGQSYVYMRDEDGLLKKQFIQTGKDIWGSYTEVKSGLTMEDMIAFPYGKDVEDGAKTVEVDVSSLYSGY